LRAKRNLILIPQDGQRDMVYLDTVRSMAHVVSFCFEEMRMWQEVRTRILLSLEL